MKKLSYLILITLVSTSLFACGGSGDEGSSTTTSEAIMTQINHTGASITDEPSVSLVEPDVAKISCGENDYTEGGSLEVSCLDDDGNSQLDIYLTCDAGFMYVLSDDGDDSNDGYWEDICVKVFCIENGTYAQLSSCDSSSY